jgi:hypothetical protein
MRSLFGPETRYASFRGDADPSAPDVEDPPVLKQHEETEHPGNDRPPRSHQRERDRQATVIASALLWRRVSTWIALPATRSIL